MKSSILVLIVAGLLAGCAGTVKEKVSDVTAGSIQEENGRGEGKESSLSKNEGPLVIPMRHRYPASQGVAYLASEQFILCRRKDFCTIPEQRFTERSFFPDLPKPIREEPIVQEAEVKAMEYSEPLFASVFFEEGEAEIDGEGLKVLDGLLEKIREIDPLAIRIVIAGYTDDSGSLEVNAILAEERAEEVAAYLAGIGIPEERIVTGGRPLCCFPAGNDNEEGRAKNRRAEIIVERVGEENKDE
ncbi:MAG: OmpA family protein [Nitrospiria bacterium]